MWQREHLCTVRTGGVRGGDGSLFAGEIVSALLFDHSRTQWRCRLAFSDTFCPPTHLPPFVVGQLKSRTATATAATPPPPPMGTMVPPAGPSLPTSQARSKKSAWRVKKKSTKITVRLQQPKLQLDYQMGLFKKKMGRTLHCMYNTLH